MQIVRATGADRRHVQRMLLAGSQKDDTLKNMNIDGKDAQRFWANVDKTTGLGPNGDCWEWTGSIGEHGYPRRFSIKARTYQVSHVAMTLDGRSRPSPDMYGLHSCDNKACVNPAHLRWGTDEENHRDHFERGRRGSHWLSDDLVHEILRSTEKNKDIAARLGLSAPCVCNIRKGRSHKHIFEQYCRMAG